ncbi:MAG: hypothetical protein VXW32_02635 [Myxococcota bacterium]|nr:hypothetical protein [Myxococcota bacterium]
MLKRCLLAMFVLSSSAAAEGPASEEETVKVPPAWTMVLPFGTPQFATDRSRLGLVLGGLQAVGVAGAVYSGVEMVRLAEEGEVDQELAMRELSAVSVALTGAMWLASVIDGSNAREVALKKAESARLWDQQNSTRTAAVERSFSVP